MTSFPATLATLVASLFASTFAIAQDTVLGPHGGTTGTAFSTAAAAGERLSRIDVRSGAFLDAIRLVYENRTDVATAITPWYGSTNGTPASFALDDGDFLARVEVWSAVGFVNRVRFTTNRGVQQVFGAPYPGETTQAFQLSQREVVGIVGRAAVGVTALGVVVRPVLGTHEVFGTGCAGSAGTPTIGLRSGSGPFRLGQTPVVDGGAMPPARLAILFYGASTTDWAGVPLPASLDAFGAPGCRVLVSLDVPIITQVEASGVTGHTVSVPNSTSLLGGTLGFQWLVRDAAANALGYTWSPGLKVMIGAL